MSQGDEFKLQGGAASNTEREQGNEGGKNGDHAHDGMAVARKSLAFLNFRSFEQPQGGEDRGQAEREYDLRGSTYRE
jgi:hypothetical protein